MSVHDLCCIGYITQDKIVTTKNTIFMPGGTSFYFAHAIKHLDPNGFLLVTALADADMSVAEDIRKEGIEVKTLPSAHSVCFENIYGENQNERTQRVTAKADPFTMEGLRDVNARIIHLGSLLADDFSLDVIKYLSGKGLLSVDVQGFLRKVDNEKVLPVDWPEKKEALKHIHILKANETEMEVLTGCKEPHEAALLIADWGVKEVLLTLGDKGSLIYAKERPFGRFMEFCFQKRGRASSPRRCSGRQDGLEKHRTGRECAGVVRPFFLFYPGGRQADIGRPRFLCGRPAFFP